MEDLEFDKLYSEKLSQTGAPDLSDEDWEKLSPALDDLQRRKWRLLPLWWLGALGALLLLSNLAWWTLWQRTDRQSQALTQEWRQFRQNLPATVLSDTLFRKVVVYQYDTIYKSVVARTTANAFYPGTGSFLGAPQSRRLDFGNSTNSNPLAENAGAAIGANGSAAADAGQENSFGSVAAVDKLPALSPLPFPDGQVQMLRKLNKYPEPLLSSPASRPAHTIQMLLKPKGFRAGIGAGYLSPNSKYLHGNTGFSFDLNGEFLFGGGLSLLLDAMYGGSTFNGNVYATSLGLPPHIPPSDDYVFQSFTADEGMRNYFQMTTRLQYQFFSFHRWSPGVGIGLAMQWQGGLELQGRYLNLVTGKVKSFSEEIGAGAPVAMLSLNAGLRHRMFHRWFWQSNATYLAKIDHSQPGIPAFWNISTGIQFEF